MMSIEVVTRENYKGDVIGDLSSRRGKIQQMEKRGNAQAIKSSGPAQGCPVMLLTSGQRRRKGKLYNAVFPL